MNKQTLLLLAKFVKQPSKVAVTQHRKLGEANERKTAAYRFDELQQKLEEGAKACGAYQRSPRRQQTPLRGLWLPSKVQQQQW